VKALVAAMAGGLLACALALFGWGGTDTDTIAVPSQKCSVDGIEFAIFDVPGGNTQCLVQTAPGFLSDDPVISCWGAGKRR
jgi:hypothetical protein